MTEFRKAREDESDDIIDFINYVFSEAHEPHDFKKRNPDMYNSDYPFWKDHYVVSEGGRIRATLSVTREQREHSGIPMTACEVGQVSVHPYHRGKGYMQALMNMAVGDMKKEGVDYAHLSGLRHRYEYFGFSRAECAYRMHITKTNCFHKRGEYTGKLTLDERNNVAYNGECVGRFIGNRAQLDDYRMAADAYAVFLDKKDTHGVDVMVKPYDTVCLRGLEDLCENTALVHTNQVSVYNYQKYIAACLGPRAAAGIAQDGRLTLEIDGQGFEAEVSGVRVSVSDNPEKIPSLSLTRMQAQRLFFSLTEHTLRHDLPRGWFPLTP